MFYELCKLSRVPRHRSGWQSADSAAILDKDRSAESMTLINSVCNVLPEELPVSGSPNMPVLFRDALSGITINLQRCVIAPNGCKSHLTLLAAQVVECERCGAFPRHWIWVRSLYSKKDFSVGFFFFLLNVHIFLLKGFLWSQAESTKQKCENN